MPRGYPLPKVAIPKRGDHKRKKYRPVEALSDQAYLCEKKLLGWSSEAIREGLNERRSEIARKAALENGATKAQADAAAEEAKLSVYTLARDWRVILSSLREVQPLTAEMLLRERMLQLDEELLRLNWIEREAWESFFEAKRGRVDVETTTTEEIPRGAAGNRAGRGAEEGGEAWGAEAPARRGKTVTKKSKPRTPEAMWLAVATNCVKERVAINNLIFDAAAKLGLATMLPAEVRELHAAGADDLEKLFAFSLRHLWSGEAMIGGNQAEAADRAKLVMGALGQARQLAGRGKGDNAPGAPQVHELIFTVVPAGGSSGSS